MPSATVASFIHVLWVKIKSYLNFTASLRTKKNAINWTGVFQEFIVPELQRGFLGVGVYSYGAEAGRVRGL